MGPLRATGPLKQHLDLHVAELKIQVYGNSLNELNMTICTKMLCSVIIV